MMKRRGFLAATLVMASTMLSSQVVSSESSTASYVRGSNNNNNNNPQAQDATRSSVVGRKLSMERCLQDKATAERSEIGVECICKSKSNQGIVMVCSDQCAFCNDDQSVCGIKSTEALYDSEDGSRSGIGLVFEYLKPGTAMIDLLPKELISSATFGQGSHSDSNVNETKEGLPIVVLGIEEIGCQEDEETHNLNSCKECNVYLGGRRCNSCELVECGEEGSGIIAPVMNCTNIQSNADFNFCEKIEMDTSSPFQAFLTKQFEQCLPIDVLIPGSEILADYNPGARPRTKTEDFMGQEIPVGRISS